MSFIEIKGDGSPCERAWEWFDYKKFKYRSDLDKWLETNNQELNEYMKQCADNYPWEKQEFTTKDAYALEPDRPRSSIRRELQELIKAGKIERVKKGLYRKISDTPIQKETLTAKLFDIIRNVFS